MRILFVAPSDSVHSARWIGQLRGLGWDLHIFPADVAALHPDLRGELRTHGIPRLRRTAYLSRRLRQRLWPAWAREAQATRLARLIRRLRPDVVHSMEIQHAAYLTFRARSRLRSRGFPPWMVSNWGSDISLFGRLGDHRERIAQVMSACDYYHTECRRDVALGLDMGFRGQVMPVLPVPGGIDVGAARSLIAPGRTSERRAIALKGYQNWAGRALVGLRAIEACADLLRGYRVYVYLAEPDVRFAAALVGEATGIPIECEWHQWAREDVLRMHGRARVSIGLSIGDGISASLLEAMVMGSFPIQSDTGCGNEWIGEGNGALVPPESPDAVAAALRRALTDDALVNRAAATNARLVMERVDVSVIRPQVVAMYENIARRGRG